MRRTDDLVGIIIRVLACRALRGSAIRRGAMPPPQPAGGLAGLAIAACLAMVTVPASGQASVQPRVLSGGGGGVVVIPADPMLNPDSPEARAYAALQRERRGIEKELRILRRRHFGAIRVVETRELGMRALREYRSKPAVLAMIEVFENEDRDVREALLDHFATLEPELGPPALAWEAVHGEGEWYRAAARDRLSNCAEIAARASADSGTPETPAWMPAIRGVIANGLQSPSDAEALAATQLAGALDLFEFIPLIATAQVAQRGGGGGGDQRTGDLGWIIIGRQQTFVADLQPIVGNSAVAFDPQIGVITDGVMLRIHDAVVTAFRTEIHRTLVDWTTAEWGKPTGALGYDAKDWTEWYTDEFLPSRGVVEPAADVSADMSADDTGDETP